MSSFDERTSESRGGDVLAALRGTDAGETLAVAVDDARGHRDEHGAWQPALPKDEASDGAWVVKSARLDTSSVSARDRERPVRWYLVLKHEDDGHEESVETTWPQERRQYAPGQRVYGSVLHGVFRRHRRPSAIESRR